MKICASLIDTEFEPHPIHEERKISRALVYDENGKFAFHHLCGDDIFGHRDYLETPGGGVDNGETYEEAVIRECKEEIGYDVEVVAPIGEIDDYYNLIGRKNLNHYFLCKRVGPYKGRHFVSSGDKIIKETLYLPLAEALKRYKDYATTPIAKLVYKRESIIIEEAMKDFPGLSGK